LARSNTLNLTSTYPLVQLKPYNLLFNFLTYLLLTMTKQVLTFGLSLLFLLGISISTAIASDDCSEANFFDFSTVNISVSPGAVHVSSTAGIIQKVACVKNYVETTYCSSSCGSAMSVNLASGRYNVKVWTGAGWVLFQKEVDIPSGGNNGNANGNNGNANGNNGNANGNNGNANGNNGNANGNNGNANGNNGNANGNNGNANGNNGNGNNGTTTGGGGVQVCADRVASNTTSCTGAYYGGYLSLNGLNPSYRLDNGRFVEYTNGTALLTGTWVNNSDPNRVFNVNIAFSGRTNTPPSGSPKDDICNLNQNTGGFYYYTTVSGTLTGTKYNAGVVLGVSNVGPAFQVGEGANITHNSVAFGASGWLAITIRSNPNNVPINLIPAVDGDGQFADINILLSGSPTACASGSGNTTGGSTTGGSTTGGSTTGGSTTGGSTTGGNTTGGSTTGGGTTGCPTITGGNGIITISGDYIQKIAYLSSTGDKVLCQGTCGANSSHPLAAGTYTVKVWYGSAWEVCQKTVTVTGGSTTGGSTTGGSTTGGSTTGGSTTGGSTTGGSTTGGSTTGGSTTGGSTCYVASNTSFCQGYGQNYGGFLLVGGKNGFYAIQNGVFTQNNNGTATLTGRWVNIANANMFFDVSFQFSGGYTNSSPKSHECGLPQSTAYSYSHVNGTLVGGGTVAGVVLRATATGPDFQVGQNANITNTYNSFGASGWLSISVESGNISIETGADGQNADINVNLWNGACSRSRAFTDFNAFEGDRAIDLEWVTNNTYISDHYIIEKSANGVDFEELTQVANETFSLDAEYFQNIDVNPVLGNNYYRLKQVFQDGTFEYSAVRIVRFGIDLKVVATFPNPAQNELFINLQEYAGQQGTITISNQFGGIVEEINIAELPSDLLSIDVSNYENGIYFMRTKIARSKIISNKIIVSKMY